MITPHRPGFSSLSNVSMTMFITAAARAYALEKAPDIGFDDYHAKKLLNLLPVELTACNNDLTLIRSVALRASIFDKITINFIKSNPGSVIINYGCGLCSRGLRMRERFNGSVPFQWFDADLPEAIDIRLKYMKSDFGHIIPITNEDQCWIPKIIKKRSKRALLIMEGVALYFEQNKIEKFLIDFGNIITEYNIASELLFDYIHPDFAGSENMKYNYGDSYATYKSGFKNIDSIRCICPVLKFKHEYHIFSNVSNHHASFETKFKLQTNGQWPYTIVHFNS
ncbi:MAG: class I SAM-dependent methyltransferase [Chitinispirillaceae bacterium]|nr:class I SAM-dependent methyltransferase [Chitinispirillaceae bacterium]